MAKTQTKAFTAAKPIVLPQGAQPQWTAVDIEFSSTAYSANDYIQLCTLPAGFKCLDWALVFPDIDPGSAAIAWSLGVSDATLAIPVSTDIGSEVWGSALTAGQSTAIVRNTTSVCAQGRIAATSLLSGDREIVLKCTTAAATYAGSGKVGQLLMLLQG